MTIFVRLETATFSVHPMLPRVRVLLADEPDPPLLLLPQPATPRRLAPASALPLSLSISLRVNLPFKSTLFSFGVLSYRRWFSSVRLFRPASSSDSTYR